MYRALADDLNPWWRDPQARRARAYPVRRHLQPRLLRQILDLGDRRAQVVEGPRQVGKTVMLRQLVDDLLDHGWPPGNVTYFDFSDERLVEEVPAGNLAPYAPVASAGHPRILFLDEVTLSPRWNDWLKRAVDESRATESGSSLKIIATDSSSNLLRTGSGETGQGRWDLHLMETLSLPEVLELRSGELGIERLSSRATQADLLRRSPRLTEDYLRLGGYPEPWQWSNRGDFGERLRSDVLDRAVNRDLGKLKLETQRPRQLMAYLLEISGAELDLAKTAVRLGADQRTLKVWLEALERTRCLWRLRRFGGHASGLGSHFKAYAADPGLVTAFALQSEGPKRQGQRVEAAVYRHLRELGQDAVSFWREKKGRSEGDFVWEAPGRRVLVECTASRSIVGDKLGTTHRAAKAIEATRALLVYGGLEEAIGDGIHQVPVGQFLLDPERYLREEAP